MSLLTRQLLSSVISGIPSKTIPDKTETLPKSSLFDCLCVSQASDWENLVSYALDTSVSINDNLAVPLYLIPVASRAVHETRANCSRRLKTSRGATHQGLVF